MITIKSLCYYTLTNDEFLGLEQKIASFTTGLTNEKITSSVTGFKAAVTKLSNQLALNVGETVKHTAKRLNDDRITAYNSLREIVKPIRLLADAASAALGKTYYAYFEGHEYLYGESQDAITGIINTVTAAFRTHSTEELTSQGIERWLANLEQCETAYEAAAQARGEEADSHVNKLTVTCREECEECFAVLVNEARYLAMHDDDAACRDFIEQVNGEIALRKEKLKVRKNAAKKKNAEANAAKTDSTAETAKVENTTATVAETINTENNTETIKAVA